MKLMKTLSCLMILSLAFASYAEAKGRTFSGGFRSQRVAQAPRPAPKATPAPTNTTQNKTAFGSFGSKSGATPTTANGQPLNMSKDLNANAAQGNALKTADGRSTSNTADTGSGWFRSGGAAKTAAPGAAAAGAATAGQAASQAAARQGGGFLNNIMWFMLGSSLASHTRAAAPAPAEQAPATEVAQPAQAGQDAAVAQSAVNEALPASPQVEDEPMLLSLLRIVLWVAIFAGIYWLVKSLVGRNRRAAKKPNYTFGNN